MSHSTQPDATPGTTGARLVLGLVLGAWFLVAVLGSGAGWFATAPGRPPLPLLVAVLGPIVLFAAVYALSERFRTYVRTGDPVLLTHLQSWRILGGIFLALMAFGLLPAAFAGPAGWGDVVIGVTAPFVAQALAVRGAARMGRLFVGWQLLGILDLVVAVGTGTSLRLAGADGAEQMAAMGRLPLSLIPGFAVPLFVILHFASIAQVRAALAREVPREPVPVVLGGVG
jgi:hypothetical protein